MTKVEKGGKIYTESLEDQISIAFVIFLFNPFFADRALMNDVSFG